MKLMILLKEIILLGIFSSKHLMFVIFLSLSLSLHIAETEEVKDIKKDNSNNILLIDSVFGDNILANQINMSHKEILSKFENYYLKNKKGNEKIFYQALNSYYGITKDKKIDLYDSMFLGLLRDDFPLAYYWIGIQMVTGKPNRAKFYFKKSYCLGYKKSAIQLAIIYTARVGLLYKAKADKVKFLQWLKRSNDENIDESVCS